MWAQQSPTSPTHQQHEFIISTNDNITSNLNSNDGTLNNDGIVDTSYHYNMRSNTGNNNSSSRPIHNSLYAGAARHVFLHSHDYSLFRKTERLVWQLNHLHANVKQLIQKSEHSMNSSHVPSPSSPSLSTRNIQVIASSVKHQKELSMRKNRFLRNNIHLLDMPSSHFHHHTHPSFDESVVGFTSSSIISSINTPEYTHERINSSIQNSPSMSEDSLISQYHGITHPFPGELSLPRSMSIDQLNQATNNGIVRSISIDQIHYNGSNNNQGGVVILPSHLYGDQGGIFSSSPKGVHHTLHESFNSLEISSIASNEELFGSEEHNMELLPSTLVHTIYSKYGLVLTIDVSPSMLAMDPTTGEVLFDRVFVAISNVITHLIQPLTIPNYNGEIIPEIHVTCVAIGMAGRPVFSLFQDCHITTYNLNEMLGKIYQQLCDLENLASTSLKNSKANDNLATNLKFSQYVKDSLLALEFLPPDACPILMLVSDSVFNLSDLNSDIVFDINQRDVSIAILNITSQSNGHGHLYSYVPDSELIESLVACTDGVYIDFDYMSNSENEMNEKKKTKALQYGLLLKSPSILIADNESLILSASEGSIFPSIPSDSIKKDIRKNFFEYDVLTYNLTMSSVDPILKKRAIQGFRITDIKYTNPTDKLSKFKAEDEKLDLKYVKMSLLYRRNLEIIYKVHVERFGPGMEDQDLDVLSSNSFSGFGISKANKAKISVTISVFMHKNNLEKFKAFLKKRTKEPFLKHLQEYIQSINIEDVLVEQYFNLSENCSGLNRSSIRKMDIPNINFDHERECFFETQKLALCFNSDENIQKSDVTIQKILSQIQTGTSDASPTVQNNLTLFKSFCENGWCSTKISDDIFILFISEQDHTCYMYDTVHDTTLLTMEEKDTSVSCGFCLLKIAKSYTSVVELKFQFFNVSSFTIFRVLRHFKEQALKLFYQRNIHAHFIENSAFSEIVARLPICKDDESQYQQSLFSHSPHFTSYLKHRNWIWPIGGRLNIAAILSCLLAQRVNEGFSLVITRQSVVFFKELEITKTNYFSNSDFLSKLILFYCIHILKKEKKLVTEVWVEPQSGYVTYSNGVHVDSNQFCTDLCDNWFHNLDLQVISLFSTFENIVTACKSGKGNNSITVFQPDKPGSITPFNLKGVFERSEHQNLKFSVFKFITHTDTDVETAKKSNIALYDRLLKILCNINDVEISLDRIPLNLDMKARCFARVFENIGSDKQKDFLLTIVPSHVTGEEKDFTIIVCVCTEDQLLFVDKLKRNENMERVVCSKHSPSILRNPALAHDEEHALASSATYCDFVTNLHAYSFTYGVYKYLNQKLMIDRESIVSAVESCYEYREEIDLTEFFEAILLSRNYFFDKSENDTTPCENMVNSFKTIIEKYFEEIKGTKFHFYLRESSIPKSTKTVPKPIKKKNSVKSFDHLEEIDNEENYDEDVSDDEIHSFHSGEDETTHSLSSLSAGMRDVQTSDHQSDSLTESSGSSVSDAFNLTELENSTIPVFMRMECVLTPIKRGKEEWEDLDDLDEYANDLKLPIKNIPIERISKSIRSSNGDFSKLSSSFGEKEEDSEEDDESDFTPSKLKTEMDFDWINSLNTVKTTLRFYCITLPPDKYCASFNGFEPSKKDVLGMFRSHVSETQSAYARSKFELEDDVFDGDTTDEAAPYLDKGYLPRHIRRIVSRTKKRLQALVSKEILNALLRTHPITSYSIKKVFDNVEKLPASCYQKHTIPLFFIDPVEGAKLFHQELLKCKNVVFKSIDNHYVVYFRKRNCCQKHAIFEEYDRKCEHELPPGDTPNKFKIFSKELNDLDMTMFDNDTEMERSCIEVPFWIILKAESKKSMSMLFYSPNSLSISQANDVVNIVFKAVGVVCKRVNTLLLLSNLHDTRICSSLLLPVRRDKDKKAVSEVSVLDKKFLRKDNEKPSSDKFNEGDFACKKTFEISFPLHSRLSTAMAINHLNQVVFNPFVVANRSEMFVYKERSGRVFYLQLTDGNKQNSTTVQTPKSEESPTLVSSARDEQEHKTKLKEYSISLSSMGQYLYAEFDIKNDISSVILEVYGVYPPSIEITTQLRNLIEAKLSSLTMNIISNLLLRNRQFKITVEDLQFIRPLLSQPHKSVVITLPKFINNKLLFMLFARNNMLTYMNQLYLTSSDESAESPSTISYMSFTEDEEDDMVFKAADFSFLYNSVTQNTYSRAMTSQVNCRGIACVQMTLLNQDGEMVTVFPSMKEPYTCDLTGVSQLGLLQEEPSNIAYTDFGAPILRKEGSNSDDEDDEENVIEKSASAAHRSENGKILLEVWKKGDVDLASLIEKLCLTLNQTLIDYIIECGLFTSPVNLEGLNRYFLVRLQTQAIKACRISSPTLMEHRASLFLPLWEMNRFIGDLYNLLSAYSFKLRPITFVSKDTRQTFVKYSRSNDFIEQYHLVDSSNICFVMMAGNFSVLTDKVINIGENIKIGDIISLDGFSYRNSIKYTRKCCIVIILTSSELQVIAYNWKPQQFEKFKYHLHQTVSWLRCRAHLLNSILHQKLGLFYHSHSTNLATVPTNLLIPLGKPQKEVQFAFNNIDLLIYNKQSAPSDPKSSNTMRRTNPAVTTSTTTNNPTGSMIPPKQPILDVRGGQMYNRFKNPGMNSTLVTSSVNDISVKTDIQKVRKEKKPPSSKNQFGSLLKGIFDLDKTPCKQLAKKTMNDNKPRDPLLIHGLHFKHIVHQNYKKKVEQQQVSKIYGFWNKSQSTNLKSKDFQLIKNTSRLIHFCRVPLLFNPLRRILFSPSSFISSSSAAIIQHLDSEGVTGVEEQQNNNLREIGYHRKVFESFLSEYVEYIKSLDISDVFLHPSDQHDSSPLLASTPSDVNPITTSTDNKSRPQPTPLVQVVGNQIIKLQPTTIYFHKQMDDGVLFLELGLDSIYVYLNVYISDITSQRPSWLNPRASTRGEFLKKVSQFKHSLHMNSFSYDFHLRNFLNYLTTDYSGFPSTLSFMSLLKDFNQFYPNPPPHTRNILHSHTITFENVKDIAEIMREKATTPKSSMKSLERGRSYSTERREMLNDPFQFFFEYICKHSDKYKVKFSQKSKECFILDTYISHEEADYSYCVLVTKSVVHSDSHTTFSYHGASSTNSSRSPSPQEEDSTMNLTMYIVFVDATNRHPYDSEIEGSKDNMYKVITQMAQQYERKLANLLQSVKNSFKLDILWDMALKFRMSENLFNELDALWTKTQITEYDFTLSIFEATYVPWNDVISELWNIYGGERAGSIFKKDGTAQHLLITPSNRSTDFMLHIHYKIKENSVIIYFCKKKLANEPEPLQDQTHSASMLRSPNTNMPSPAVRVDQKSEGAQSLIIIPNQTERDFIGSFVNHVCYVLYRLSF